MSENAKSSRNQHVAPFIYEEKNSKSLHFTIHQLQSKMSISRPDELKVDYTKTMMGFVLLNRRPKHIVMIGLGGGSLAKFCYKHLPESRITVIEINPHVIALRNEFLIPEDNYRFKVIEADGADYIRNSPRNIDVLLVDGYDHQGQPPQLSSERFYLGCSEALTEQGVMAVNLHEDHSFYELFLDRLGTAFKQNIVEVAANHEGNVIVFASPGVKISPTDFRTRMESFYSELTQWNSLNA